MKARDLKALKVDLEGRLTFEDKPVSVIPVGRPDIVYADKRTRTEGCLRHGTYGYFEETVKIPEGADSFVLGMRASSDYAPIQFYKIVKSNRHQSSTYSEKGERKRDALSDALEPRMIFPIPARDMRGQRNSGEWEHWENEL